MAELIAGERISGSWWAHPLSHEIFDGINPLAESPDVVRTRLVNGKVTLIHRRVWPALVRTADGFPIERLAAIREEHTATGAHRATKQDFPDWVPTEVLRESGRLSEDAALAELPACVRLMREP